MGQGDEQGTVSVEEVVKSLIIQEEAMVQLLIRKGVFTREEIGDEIRAVRQRLQGRGAVTG